MKTYYLIFFLCLCSCSTLKENMIVNGNKNDAIENAILDFVHTEKKLLKCDKVFSISAEEYQDNTVITILGNLTRILLIIEENGSYNYCLFPTRLIETHDKLFFWYDETKSVTDTIINTLCKYNLVDTVDIYSGTIIFDDAKKAAAYYFCKNNLSEYRKIVTNRGSKWHK